MWTEEYENQFHERLAKFLVVGADLRFDGQVICLWHCNKAVASLLLQQEPRNYSVSDLSLLYRQVAQSLYQLLHVKYVGLEEVVKRASAERFFTEEDRRIFHLGVANKVLDYLYRCERHCLNTRYDTVEILEIIVRNQGTYEPFPAEDERKVLQAAPATLMMFGNIFAHQRENSGAESLVQPNRLELVC